MMQLAVDPDRFHPRVEANFMVKVQGNGSSLLARARDLSMAGLFLQAAVPAGRRRVAVAIPLPNDREVVTVGTVRRREQDGVGIEFDPLDWDDLCALARFLHPRLP